MLRRLPRLTMTAATALLLGACAEDAADRTDGAGDEAGRTIEIEMVDIAYEPATLEVDEGETVRFVFTNSGAIAHDAFIGAADAQAAHEAEMRAADNDAHGGHDEASPDAVTVAPGDTAELTHTFDEAGTIEIGCHQEGHYEAGMKLTVEVS